MTWTEGAVEGLPAVNDTWRRCEGYLLSLVNPALAPQIPTEGTFLHFSSFDTTSEMLGREYFLYLPDCAAADDSCPEAVEIDIYLSEIG